MIPYLPWQAGVRRILRTGAPYVFYIHPWEIDPGQPRVAGLGRLNRIRHYLNLGRCEDRYRALVSSFQWTTVKSVLDNWKRQTGTGRPAGQPLLTGRSGETFLGS
jgi:hypothetical protein